MTGNDKFGDEIEPRDRCPRCNSLVEHASKDPLEEFCIEPGCDYYRAEAAGGVIRE